MALLQLPHRESLPGFAVWARVPFRRQLLIGEPARLSLDAFQTEQQSGSVKKAVHDVRVVFYAITSGRF
jgi:hypothetical protein